MIFRLDHGLGIIRTNSVTCEAIERQSPTNSQPLAYSSVHERSGQATALERKTSWIDGFLF